MLEASAAPFPYPTTLGVSRRHGLLDVVRAGAQFSASARFRRASGRREPCGQLHRRDVRRPGRAGSDGMKKRARRAVTAREVLTACDLGHVRTKHRRCRAATVRARPAGMAPALVLDQRGTDQNTMTKQAPVLDPNHEPLRVSDHITLHPMVGQCHDFTFCTSMYLPKPDGEFEFLPVVTARIRITSDMARAIVTGLSQQLTMMEVPSRSRN